MRSNEDLTIGELAKMNDVSTHQIRFYEEKGILKPAYIDDNGYRKYNLDSMYQMSHVMMLREMNISVGKIREAMEKDTSIYIDEIEKSILGLKRQIRELEEKVVFTESTLEAIIELRDSVDTYSEVYYEQSQYGAIVTYTVDEWPTPKEVYEGYVTNGLIGYKHPLTTFVLDRTLYLSIKNFSSDITLTKEEGRYLKHVVVISDFSELTEVVNDYLTYAYENGYKLCKQMVIREECCNTYIDNHIYVMIIEAKII
ncbi:MerR family transcriptional regulator [Acidaminobacter sp. JC074]|uniref:MerR family transcriptional regulator n=1 Tax=Acidaminobacter sp. JC074 TaxID=2530199 RepID=UPI001F0DA1FD|nr:MerR family transcriptional regulator [Acidaminobacter sp. JC074]MCH4887838.1 MerR family transcriptional regulator [Acidaminobacter sp. JC074]